MRRTAAAYASRSTPFVRAGCRPGVDARRSGYAWGVCGCSSMVEHQVSTLGTRVRFPPPASSELPVTLFSQLKTDERDLARKLRATDGLSIKEIAGRVGVSVSSVSRWVRGVELTPVQTARLAALNPALNGQLSGARTRSQQERARRREYQLRGRSLVRSDLQFAEICMLYWAEGSKARNAALLTNSDPAMLAFFVAVMKRSFELPPEAFRVTCNLFADHLARQCVVEQYWLDVMSLPSACLRASTLNRYSSHSKRKRSGVLPYGTCRVGVYRTSVVQAIFGGIQEVGGFERPQWLDC
jgi:transcriptional regulator with XRE-family HTH domain